MSGSLVSRGHTETLASSVTTRIEVVAKLDVFRFVVFQLTQFMMNSAEEWGQRNNSFSPLRDIPLPPFLCLKRC